MVRLPISFTFIAAAAILAPALAHAQLPQGGPPGGAVGGEEDKPEGAAEKAPSSGELPTTPYLPPWPGEKQKAFELVELDGYFRLRTDWLDNFHLGLHDLGEGTAFPEPASCDEDAMGNDPPPGCKGSVGTANLRLRLEPTIHLSEKVSVHLQVDVLDNLVLGSTPEGPRADVLTGAFSDNQDAPEADGGQSIVVKRAWAEVTLPLGMLKFGRMPAHWGVGMTYHGGGADPYHPGRYCLDCDGGDTVDRVYYSATIPGTGFEGAVGLDWASSEPVFDAAAAQRTGQGFDGDDNDDAKQWVFAISDLDKPDDWKETLDAGDVAIGWGVQLVYRKQGYQVLEDAAGVPSFERRAAYLYNPDGYFRLGYKKISFEVEFALNVGNIEDLGGIDGDLTMAGVQDIVGEVSIFSLGGVARFTAQFSNDELELGVEAGFASGDDCESALQGETHYTRIPTLPQCPGDNAVSAFLFDPNFHVDLILFRELLGTVRNAIYAKPTLSYKLTNRLTFKSAAVLSMAHEKVSTPGNEGFWGIELDGDLGYANEREGFFAGISYGVLFPLSAMDHPNTIFSTSGGVDAGTAQTIQMRLVLKF